MRLVVDTNVLVAGILSASGPPGWIVEALLSGEIEPVLDAGIRAEYEDVLRRPELSLDPERVAAVLDVIDAFGLEAVVPPWPEPLPDPDDAPFLAVAAWVGCPLVTGNIRRFPARARRGVAVLTPRQLVDDFARRP
jgi:predicted nucleic acid-binding protein